MTLLSIVIKTTLTFLAVLVPSSSLQNVDRSTDDFSAAINVYPSENKLDPPLIVTPLINSGNITEAQNLSRVNLSDVVSYSGFFTVEPKYNSNIFFWFFPAVLNPETAPVLLWLNGGPGASSMFGLLFEIGPFVIDALNNFDYRNTSWSLTHSVLYLDSPVGTGFSFTDDDAGYANSEDDVANGLYNALTQFFTLFPQYQERNFFLTGESYAGKYIPILSWKIHQKNKLSPKVKMNIKGIAIGDAFTDPENMMEYGNLLYTVGLLDEQQKIHFQQEEDKVRWQIKQNNWLEAYYIFDSLLFGSETSTPSLLKNYTGFDFAYNFLINTKPNDFGYYKSFFEQRFVRQAIHVGNLSFNDSSLIVTKHMGEVILQSAAPFLSKLLDAPDKYKILYYNGQLDICVANIFIDNFLSKLQWHGAEDFLNAEKKLWKVSEDLAGYVKVTDNLTYLIIRNAGHIVPYDQPEWSFDMINRFTSGKSF